MTLGYCNYYYKWHFNSMLLENQLQLNSWIMHISLLWSVVPHFWCHCHFIPVSPLICFTSPICMLPVAVHRDSERREKIPCWFLQYGDKVEGTILTNWLLTNMTIFIFCKELAPPDSSRSLTNLSKSKVGICPWEHLTLGRQVNHFIRDSWEGRLQAHLIPRSQVVFPSC